MNKRQAKKIKARDKEFQECLCVSYRELRELNKAFEEFRLNIERKKIPCSNKNVDESWLKLQLTLERIKQNNRDKWAERTKNNWHLINVYLSSK